MCTPGVCSGGILGCGRRAPNSHALLPGRATGPFAGTWDAHSLTELNSLAPLLLLYRPGHFLIHFASLKFCEKCSLPSRVCGKQNINSDCVCLAVRRPRINILGQQRTCSAHSGEAARLEICVMRGFFNLSKPRSVLWVKAAKAGLVQFIIGEAEYFLA